MFGNKIYLIITLIILSSCQSVGGNRIKLEKFPTPNQEQVKKLSIAHDFYSYDNETNISEGKLKWRYSSIGILEYFQDLGIKTIEKTPNANCKIRISSKYRTNDNPSNIDQTYQMVNILSLYTLPYIWINPYQVKAELISTKNNKILKKYYLRENSYDTRSVLWFLTLLYPPMLKSERLAGSTHTAAKISKAITRQIVSDALGFEECLK